MSDEWAGSWWKLGKSFDFEGANLTDKGGRATGPVSKGFDVGVSVGDQPGSMEGNSVLGAKGAGAAGGYIVEGV